MLSPRKSWWAAAIAFGVLCLAAYASVVLGDLATTEERLRSEVTATARLMRTHASEAFETGRRTLEKAAAAVRDLKGGRASRDEVYARFQDLVAANPAFGTLWAVDADGRSMLSNMSPVPEASAPTGRDYFWVHTRERLSVHVGPREVGTVMRRPRFTLSVAVRDEDERLVAVVAGGVDASYFETLYAAIDPRLGTRAALALADGRMLASWPEQDAPLIEPRLVPQLAMARGTTVRDADGGLVAIDRLTDIPVVVVARAPPHEIFAAWRGRAALSAIPVALALLAFGLLTRLGLDAVAANELARQGLEDRVRERTEQLNLLLGELNHRVKNNLQIVSSLVQASLSSIRDPAVAEAMRDTAHRIAALAELHRTLEAAPTEGVRASDYIGNIVTRLRESFSRPGQRIAVSVTSPAIELPTDQAVAVGIAVNELVTNAFKHAFRERTEGSVDVRLTVDDGRHVLTVADDGAGPPAVQRDLATTTPSQGSRILRAMVQRLGGSFDVVTGPGGTVATIAFPAAATAVRV